MDDSERRAPAPEADATDKLWRQIQNMAIWERTQETWRTFKEEHVNAAEAVREAGLPECELARHLLGRKAGACLLVDKARLEEERALREIGGSGLPLSEVVPPEALHELYRENQNVAVSALAGHLEQYCLHRSDWEALKATLKPAGKGGQDEKMDGRSRDTYLKLIASLYAHLKKNHRGEVAPAAILDFKGSRWNAGSGKSKTTLAKDIASLTEQAGLSVGYRTVEKIMDEIQELIGKQ